MPLLPIVSVGGLTLHQFNEGQHVFQADIAFHVVGGCEYVATSLAHFEQSGGPHLIDSFEDIQPEWLKDVKTIALTAGASAPECLVEETMKFLSTKGFANVQELEVMPENVRFGLPPEIVEAIAAAPASATAD